MGGSTERTDKKQIRSLMKESTRWGKRSWLYGALECAESSGKSEIYGNDGKNGELEDKIGPGSSEIWPQSWQGNSGQIIALFTGKKKVPLKD